MDLQLGSRHGDEFAFRFYGLAHSLALNLLANNPSGIIVARHHPIKGEQASFQQNESNEAAKKTEKHDGKSPQQKRAEGICKHLRRAIGLGLVGCEVRHLHPPEFAPNLATSAIGGLFQTAAWRSS
ncbi:hypothetical protein [Bradyrhizobium sp. DOA9]|uniref:hypothetical protein n=1 Tax=Bradyrhizobium sp. DOA9 TaxID=1126627 RepID=UPI0007232780|nr:hypothetical protein [Bradyrhizobium sp. DOA9]GAJ32484.1 hypothetical protein BDOA9_0116730 [Bradyrhizobium sp. DOA9]